MLGLVVAVALLASADAEIAPYAVPLGGSEQHLDGATWSAPVAGMGALGLVGGDVVAFMAGAALIGLTANSCEAGGLACNGSAVVLALAGIVRAFGLEVHRQMRPARRKPGRQERNHGANVNRIPPSRAPPFAVNSAQYGPTKTTAPM